MFLPATRFISRWRTGSSFTPSLLMIRIRMFRNLQIKIIMVNISQFNASLINQMFTRGGSISQSKTYDVLENTFHEPYGRLWRVLHHWFSQRMHLILKLTMGSTHSLWWWWFPAPVVFYMHTIAIAKALQWWATL